MIRRRRFRSFQGADAGSDVIARGEITPRGATIIVRPPTVEIQPKWTVAQVDAALMEHEMGHFVSSSKLIDAMGRDDRISGCLDSRVRALFGKHGAKFSIEPPQEGGSVKLAKECSLWWPKCTADSVLQKLDRDQVMAGLAIARVQWIRTELAWYPKLIHWPLSAVMWSELDQKFMVFPREGTPILIEPGDPDWFVLTPGGDRSWMCGAVRALGYPFVMRNMNWRDWARFNERHGVPIIAIKEPSGAGDKKDKDRFYEGIKNLGRSGILRMPQGADESKSYDISFKEPAGTAAETFPRFRSDLDAAIAICLNGQNLTTEVKGGSHAATESHMVVRQDFADADGGSMSAALRAQPITYYCFFNVKGFKEDDAPCPTWDTTPPEDTSKLATTFSTAATATMNFRKVGAPIDYPKMFERLSLPFIEGQDFEPPDTGEDDELDDNEPSSDKPGARADVSSVHARRKRKPDGVLEGQTYGDRVANRGAKRAADSVDVVGFAEALLAICEEGGDYETITNAVIKAYEGTAQPEELVEIIERVWIMSQRAGEVAVQQDV